MSKLAQFRQLITTRWDKFFVMGDPPDYEPPEEMSVAAIANREGRRPDEVAYDYLTEAENRYLFFPVVNYVNGDHARSMHADDRHAPGLERRRRALHLDRRRGRAELHARALGTRPRRGPRLPVELLVKRQTSETADFFGLPDRGRLAPGLRADVNLIDFDRLAGVSAGARERSSCGRPPLRAARRRLRSNLGRRNAHLRARQAYRRDARSARARGTRVTARHVGWVSAARHIAVSRRCLFRA